MCMPNRLTGAEESVEAGKSPHPHLCRPRGPSPPQQWHSGSTPPLSARTTPLSARYATPPLSARYATPPSARQPSPSPRPPLSARGPDTQSPTGICWVHLFSPISTVHGTCLSQQRVSHLISSHLVSSHLISPHLDNVRFV